MVTRPKAVAEIVRYPSGTLKMKGSRLGGEMRKTFERSGRPVKETKFACPLPTASPSGR